MENKLGLLTQLNRLKLDKKIITVFFSTVKKKHFLKLFKSRLNQKRLNMIHYWFYFDEKFMRIALQTKT